jgi:hypothetical protein
VLAVGIECPFGLVVHFLPPENTIKYNIIFCQVSFSF